MPYPVSPPTPLAVLLKATAHLVRKATPLHAGSTCIGYKVPAREFERVRCKMRILQDEVATANRLA
jgi:hypothetical protein